MVQPVPFATGRRQPATVLSGFLGAGRDGAELSRRPDTAGNDVTVRDAMWRRYEGDAWAAFEQLPPAVRARMREHAYDAWSVNALMLWRHYRRLHPSPARAERALLRYLDHCERLERRAFAQAYSSRWGTALPHDAAGLPVLRYGRAVPARA